MKEPKSGVPDVCECVVHHTDQVDHISDVVKNRVFERLVVLSSRFGPGTIEEVIDGTNLKALVNTAFR
jgi:stage III sporulation protein SpoIIIAA